MWRTRLLWVAAVVIMFAAAEFQDRTGPTNELDGDFEVGGESFSYELNRSGNSDADAGVVIPNPGGGIRGQLFFKRYPTADPFQAVPMESLGQELVGLLPRQPAAGKLEYYIILDTPEGPLRVPEEETVIIRFKDPVPVAVLAPHIILMFFSLLLGVRTALGALFHPVNVRRLAWITLALTTVGGMILGPVVQKYAFGALWTGWPFGYDLTDNKTLIMWIVWLAVVAVLKFRPDPRDALGRGSVVLAAAVMLAVYLIPHSLRGSELDYSTLESEVETAGGGETGLAPPSFDVGSETETPGLGLPSQASHGTIRSQPHTVVRVTERSLRGAAELSVAINPTDPSNVVIVSLAAGPPEGPRTTDYAYASKDGGQNWSTVRQPNPDARTQGDDAVTFDLRGRVFRSYISFDGIRMARPPKAWNGIFVSRSDDGGTTWQTPVPVVDHINTVEPFEDKPWLAADVAADSPHRGNVYVAWTRFDEYGSADPADSTQILFSRSVDGGLTFSVPLRISDSGGDALDGDNTVEGAVPAVGPGGEVYLTWAGPRGLVFDRSLDGGWTFGADRVISDNPGGWDIPLPGVSRHNGMPVTAVDLSDGEHRGRIYVNWIDERNGDTDVFLISSDDGGESWTRPLRVNGDPVANGRHQLFTWMAVDPVDGAVNVVFLDRSGTEGDTQTVTLARSEDGGRSFQSHGIDQPAFSCPPSIFYGDYLTVAARGGKVIPAWPHCSATGEQALFAALFQFGDGED